MKLGIAWSLCSLGNFRPYFLLCLPDVWLIVGMSHQKLIFNFGSSGTKPLGCCLLEKVDLEGMDAGRSNEAFHNEYLTELPV